MPDTFMVDSSLVLDDFFPDVCEDNVVIGRGTTPFRDVYGGLLMEYKEIGSQAACLRTKLEEACAALKTTWENLRITLNSEDGALDGVISNCIDAVCELKTAALGMAPANGCDGTTERAEYDLAPEFTPLSEFTKVPDWDKSPLDTDVCDYGPLETVGNMLETDIDAYNDKF